MRNRILAFAISAALSLPATASVDSLAMMKTATHEVSASLGVPFNLEVAKNLTFAAMEGDRLRIAPEAMSSVETPNEARALVALVVAYRGRSLGKFVDRRSSAVNTVGNIIYSVGDGASDSTFPAARAIPNHTREEQRAYVAKMGAKRAALALQIASRSGSCAGPLVDLLTRMRGAAARTSAVAALDTPAAFARQAIRDLGKTAFPPDRSCE